MTHLPTLDNYIQVPKVMKNKMSFFIYIINNE
jgi:hypothetical protein